MMDIQKSFDDLNQQIKTMQTEIERLKKQRDAFYSATCVSNEATIHLDRAYATLRILIDSYFDGASAEDFNSKWGMDYAYNTIQNALFTIKEEILQANALAYAGMGFEHGHLQGVKRTIKEMEEAIKKVNEVNETNRN